MAPSRHKELLVHARMVEVMGDGRDQRRQPLHRSKVGQDGALAAEDVHCLCDVTGVQGVVVRVGGVVAALQQTEEGHHIRGVH